MNLAPRWVDFLNEHGHESVHWHSVGSPAAPDIDLIEYARGNDFVILTQDLDFGTLLALSGDRMPSVIQVRAQATLPDDIGRQVIAAIDAASAHVANGALVTVMPSTHRISVLPLR